MNFFESLPDEIQEKIYKCAHELKMKETLDILKTVELENERSPEFLYRELFDSDMTNKEVHMFYNFLDWLDGKNLYVRHEYFDGNKYMEIYNDYWAHVEESE